ncbi:FAD-dependent oxidoreductase [Luteimonas sp. MC1572]|nr:FAD-dependent oxidoreductase [Luteimonas sp. MC1572]QQO03169.1 FAD-dependent oxidoreductase [Luteimonas sp. MC1572]
MDMQLDNNVVIAGAGQAAATAAAELRRAGHAGAIVIVGDEAHAPYERPQLSKAMLKPGAAPARHIRDVAAFAADGIELRLGRRVQAVDAAARHVELDDGSTLAWSRLLIATGVRPRRLPGAMDVPGRVRYLRSLEDAAHLARDFDEGHALAIVGGGVIGLEVAAAAAARGIAVTLVEAADRLMPRSLDAPVSAALARIHAARGVDIRLGCQAVALHDDGSVELSDGSRVPGARVLVGIGVEPNIEAFAGLGISDALGIRVDACGRTAIEGIYAAGDVASQPLAAGHGRIETWANAQDHAVAVARNLIGEPVAYTAPTWFWSDQGGTNLQVLGDATQGTRVVRGNEGSDRFSVFRLDDAGRISGCTTLNNPKDMAMARRWMRQATRLEPSKLADPATNLSDCQS